MELHLMRPEWLWSLLPAVVLIILLWRHRGRSGSWHSVIAPELLQYLVGTQASGRTPNLLPFILAGWMAAALAASGPSWKKIPQPIHQKQDALVLLLDLSYSMKSADLQPSRLDRARQKLLDLLQLRREGQTGLIAYAGDSHIVTPLTDDTPTIANLLPALHPDMMPVPGSDPVAAVKQGVELLHSAGIRQGRLLLVTDGITDKQRRDIVKTLKPHPIQLGVMAVGTSAGAPIPLPRGGFLKDEAGTIIMPGLKEKPLRELTVGTGGRYTVIQIDDSDLDYLLADKLPDMTEQTLALERTADTWFDQGYLFILPLLPLVLALFRRGWLVSLLPLILVGLPQPSHAQAWSDLWLTPDQQGQRALQAGEDEAAADLFEDPDWAGTAAYRSGDYESAAGHFSSEDSADALYNRGNSLARAGKFEEAMAAYRQSLELDPGKPDASENLALLEKLKEQQEQQQQNQQDQQGDDSQQQEQSQGQQQSGDDSDPSSDPQQQNNQQPNAGDSQQQENNPGEQDSGETDAAEQREAQQQPTEEEGEQPQQAAGKPQAAPEDQERDQAMEQWLRRVPDDPSGLLREKFRYESRQRQEQGARRDNENYW